jgi:hypothetical protein
MVMSRRRNTDPLRSATFLKVLDLTVAERFWIKVGGERDTESVEDCWTWHGSINPDGYGVFAFDGTSRPAHRFAYEALVESLPGDLHLDHLCRNTRCVNPWHLDPVTSRVNTQRSSRCAPRTHCPHGHALSDENVYVDRRGTRNCRTCKRLSDEARRPGVNAARRAARAIRRAA